MSINPLTRTLGQTSLAADLVRATEISIDRGSAWLSEIAELEQLCKRCEAVDSNVIGEVP